MYQLPKAAKLRVLTVMEACTVWKLNNCDCDGSKGSNVIFFSDGAECDSDNGTSYDLT